MSISQECPPFNTSLLNPSGFVLNIERTPLVSYFATDATLPSISLPPLDIPTSLSTIKMPSDKLNYDSLVFNFKVDSLMNNWYELFKWIEGLGHPEDHKQYTLENQIRNGIGMSEASRNFSDATLQVMGANNKPVRTFRFIDCYPESLSGITFASNNTDAQYATATVSLAYTYFKLD